MNYADLASKFDDATPDQGFVPEPLNAGLYPLKVERIIKTEVTGNGAHRVAYLVRVTEGPFEKRTALVEAWIKSGTFKTVMNEATGKAERDSNGNVQRVKRTDEEVEGAATNTMNMMKGFLGALQLGTKEPQVGDDNPEFYNQFYDVQGWPGAKLIGYLQKQGDNNRISAFFSVDDAKRGIANWREKELPKQNAKAGKAASGGTSSSAVAI